MQKFVRVIGASNICSVLTLAGLSVLSALALRLIAKLLGTVLAPADAYTIGGLIFTLFIGFQVLSVEASTMLLTHRAWMFGERAKAAAGRG